MTRAGPPNPVGAGRAAPAERATPEEIRVMAERAGLFLSEPHFRELVDMYGHVEILLKRLNRDLPLTAAPASVFKPSIPSD